ncbi:uroporphyrinogen-III synthase [Rhodocaloribacter litoris]|uniref:uroporphyrinogen-III synthase n=1 Tax=Rhodocaloribacter litoris TaxID=2558931 RepID=UPI001421ABC7|nr:uroporphyrinogen-III synthase [Rhodocaloribacter litoris]QXD15683.1 uroporphyrinogen-III synthase [Rhodocaloribacter litoris]GIV61618.1 MAG: hypothetical protein KatS3mg044_0484 [Rhodothermaceae bacterium]
MPEALSGKRIVVTRPREQAADFCARLEAAGATVIRFPTIRIAPVDDPAPLDRALERLGTYDRVIFTSVNGVRHVWQRLEAAGRAFPPTLPVAAIGPATAAALRRHGLSPDFVPDDYVAEAIVEGLGDVRGQAILLPRADIAREALARLLARRGARVDEVAAYRTLPATPDPEGLAALEAGVDALTFTSSSTVRNFVTLLGDRARRIAATALVACIGPVTAETARTLGLAPGLVAETYTTGGLLDALIAHYAASPRTTAPRPCR